MTQPIGRDDAYDGECRAVREITKAAGCLLLIIDGERGNGLSVEASEQLMPLVPEILRAAAAHVESVLAAKTEPAPDAPDAPGDPSSCPTCSAPFHVLPESVRAHLTRTPERFCVAVCGHCGSFVHVNLDGEQARLRLLSIEEIADLSDEQRNLMLRRRREIEDRMRAVPDA